jgi:Ca2+-binding RTX toxin-like protein
VSVTNHATVTGSTAAIDAMTTSTGTVGIDNYGHLIGNITSDNATFTNELPADWSLNGTSVFTGTSTLGNAGLIDSNGTSVISGLSSFTNTGTIEAQSGSLKLAEAVTGSGAAVVYGAKMEFGAASDSHVQFSTSSSVTGTLVLDDVAHFTGTVTGFTSGDTIDLVGIAPSTVSVSNSGSLHVDYGTGFFGLIGNYDPTGFSVVSDTKGGTDIIWNHQTPVIAASQFSVVQNSDGTTTISGLQVSDSDPAASSETFTVAAITEGAASGSTVTPSTGSGSLTGINGVFSTGITYHPGTTPPSTDMVSITVADSFGATDKVNFIFNEAGTGPNITLQGTPGNDVIFATGNQDILTGGGGQDQFVFKPTSSGPSVQHTITDFVAGLDKIDVRQFSNLSASTLPTEAQQGSDTLVTLDSHDTLLLKNVSATNLHVSDFILHA